jgi:hypothetical protein
VGTSRTKVETGAKAKDHKKTPAKSRPAAKPLEAKRPRPAPAPRVAFGKKNQPPTADAFAAHLPMPLGKRLDSTRRFLLKQKEVTEDVFFYGPRSGWGLRYLAAGRPVCSLFVHEARPLAILSLDAAAVESVDWKALSDVAQKARRAAHGSPELLWVDVPLDGSGAADLKALLKAKLGSLRE